MNGYHLQEGNLPIEVKMNKYYTDGQPRYNHNEAIQLEKDFMEALDETTKKVGKTKPTKDRENGQVDTMVKRLDDLISEIRHYEYTAYEHYDNKFGFILKKFADELTEIVKAI